MCVLISVCFGNHEVGDHQTQVAVAEGIKTSSRRLICLCAELMDATVTGGVG